MAHHSPTLSYTALAASLPHEDPPLRGALASLIQTRAAPGHGHSHGHGHHDHDRLSGGDNVPSSGVTSAHDCSDDAEVMRRPAADERRLSEIINGPQMRSMRLIGKSNPRYQWERYWKSDGELSRMSRPVREYYERTNNLIKQYLFIDHLLDSSRPHDILNEYEPDSTEPAVVLARATPSRAAPIPISENQRVPLSTVPESTSYGSSMPTSTMASKKVKRTPREIFSGRSPGGGPTIAGPSAAKPSTNAASESTPLLDGTGSPSPTSTTPPSPDLEASSGRLKPDVDDWLIDGEVDSQSRVVTIAIWVNFVANALLLGAKMVVVAWVPSMSVLASLVDAALDFLSTVIVWLTTKLISKSQHDQYHYPVGRRRLEPLGVVIFSVIMITSFVQVGIQCLDRLRSSERELIQLGGPAIGIMASTVFIKGTIWVYYRLVKNSSVRALADDALTDVIFNFGSILFPIVGFYAGIWWLDALGGLMLSAIVIYQWSSSCLVHLRNLSGFSAQPDQRNLLLYLTMRFATTIRQIQNLRAYHAGDKLFVEADIVLDPSTPLRDSHDLGEVLTYFLESVPFVDRAFVHMDYASYHAPTHLLQGGGEE